MTNQQTFTVTLTAEQAEDLFDAVNIAALHYSQKAVAAKHALGAYDWRISSADKLQAYEDRRDLFTKRWVEFYQVMKRIRADEKALKEGRAWLADYRKGGAA